MTFSILLATLVALVAGALVALYPAAWVPFYRSRVVNDSRESEVSAAILVGTVGQAITSAAMGLLIAIVVLSVVAVADQNTQVWTGVAVIALSLTFFYKHFFGQEGDWERARDLVNEVHSPGKKREAKERFGPFDRTVWQVARDRAFSPSFIIAPVFVAAAGSGVASVGNAVGVVIAFAVGLVAGQLWQISLVRKGSTEPVLKLIAQRFELIAGSATAALGLLTMIT